MGSSTMAIESVTHGCDGVTVIPGRRWRHFLFNRQWVFGSELSALLSPGLTIWKEALLKYPSSSSRWQPVLPTHSNQSDQGKKHVFLLSSSGAGISTLRDLELDYQHILAVLCIHSEICLTLQSCYGPSMGILVHCSGFRVSRFSFLVFRGTLTWKFICQ